MTYPVTITSDALVEHDACEDGLAAFDAAGPSGVLHVSDVHAHVALLAGPDTPYQFVDGIPTRVQS